MTAAGRIRAGLIGCAVAVALAACGGGGGESNIAIEAQSAQQLYIRGESELAAGNPDQAAILFTEIERLYPYSDWAKRGLIMAAFAYHRDRDYEQSRAAAQRFIDFYPADPDAAYAQYLLALSYYDQINQVGRDQGLTYQALQALRAVVERYPDSEYAATAMLKFDLAFDHLAGKEMEIGRFYLKRGHYMAAINRFRIVVEDFQTTSHTPEALHRLVESYVALGLFDQAQTAAAILGHNYRGSPFYAESYEVLRGVELVPDVVGDSWLASVWRQTVRGDWL